jgi:hypothetical protein
MLSINVRIGVMRRNGDMFFPTKIFQTKKYIYPYQNLKPFYLGATISEQNSEKILEIGKKRQINIYKMEIKPSVLIAK